MVPGINPRGWARLVAPAALCAGLAAAALAAAALAEAAPRGRPGLADLAWIAGHWGGEALGGQVEELWMAPGGRSMTGSFRLVRGGEAVMYELLLLEEDEDGEVYYRFKHVTRGWVPVEETPLEFRLAETGPRRAVFRNTDETAAEGMAWFSYEGPGEDDLVVTIHGYGGGDPTVLPMRRKR